MQTSQEPTQMVESTEAPLVCIHSVLAHMTLSRLSYVNVLCYMLLYLARAACK
jgi:hypothetical protein